MPPARSSLGRRSGERRPAPLLASSLAVGVLVAVAFLPGPAPAVTAAGPAVAPALAAHRVVDPDGTPGDPGPGDETPTVTPPTPSDAAEPPPTVAPPDTTAGPAPSGPATTAAPTPTDPAPATGPPVQPAPTGAPPVVPPAGPEPGQSSPVRRGVRVTTGDLSLGAAYWNAASTVADLRVTVTNTGATTEQVRLGYTLPAGLTDAGTQGCAAAGGESYRCGAWTAAPGVRFSSLIRVRVDGDAWQRMPLGGTVRVTATGPAGSAPIGDHEGFAVLFPPGPPVAGISLDADEVAFDISGAPSVLTVRLGNTGTVDASGAVEVVLPAGVTVPTPPPGCRPAGSARTRCDLGEVAAGRRVTVRLPVAATPEAQRDAPLAGAVVADLVPRSGVLRRVQMSFRITAAAAAVTTAPATAPLPTGSQGVLPAGQPVEPAGGLDTVQRTAIGLIVLSGLLVLLALTLATTALRRRLPGRTTATPGPAAVAPAPESSR